MPRIMEALKTNTLIERLNTELSNLYTFTLYVNIPAAEDLTLGKVSGDFSLEKLYSLRIH